ncbi:MULTISPECIES: hypothetical protein [unclassified Campylobacter]|uniref:hypothetical protein n=1 Tax=unclassified Campylobacter TaxID=2593542 RepID=UPI0022EA0060|nr:MULTISPECIES: hypothetical protein [unclassified Campylobacter]MDA3055110.1 hypothetical protein [Campylobacter sp. VBCF_07 NA4]MDA3061360.1 hypothetical protein [Campylobacter sp. VBCF_02 NA5]MDA3070879.1 hypothetical protein [Campylobacter sp. VBCF_08 NA3]WBR54020.1 hypothetical protein PF027_06780 [Campylobacter sp. VBCF_01 NA2]
MKNLILPCLIALSFTGCAFFAPRTTPLCPDTTASKMQISSYTRQSKVAYTYKFINGSEQCSAKSNKYFANPGDVALISVTNGTVSSAQILSRKITPGKKESYTPTKIIKKQLHKNENIKAPTEEKISF